MVFENCALTLLFLWIIVSSVMYFAHYVVEVILGKLAYVSISIHLNIEMYIDY